MAADIVKFYTTVASKLSQLEVRNGNLIFTSDTKQIYLDIHGNRLGYNCIQVFATDTERSALLAPIEGFYFVEETGVMWRYKEKWVQISPDNLNEITFGTSVDDFPKTGNDKILYVTDDATYKWDRITKSYMVIANKTEWKTLN